MWSLSCFFFSMVLQSLFSCTHTHTHILWTLTNFHGIDLSVLRGAALEEYFKQPILVRAVHRKNSAYCYALSLAPVFFRTHLMFGSWWHGPLVTRQTSQKLRNRIYTSSYLDCLSQCSHLDWRLMDNIRLVPMPFLVLLCDCLQKNIGAREGVGMRVGGGFSST